MRIKLLFVFMLLGIAASGQQNPIQIDANGLTQTLTAGGVVTRGQIVKINSAGQVVPVLTTDNSGAIGIAATSQTSAGNGVAVSIQGTPLVQIDASGCAASNVVSISSITAGAGHCAATASGQQIGVALSISSPGSNFWNVQLSLGGGTTSPIPNSQISFGSTVSPYAYGAKWDAKFTYNATFTSSSPTVTCTATASDCSFTSADIGKIVFGYGSPQSANNGTAPYFVALAKTTITAINSATSITVGTNASNSCTTSTTQACILVWGTQDDATAINSAATAAWSTAGVCKAVELPSGIALIGGPVLNVAGANLSVPCGGGATLSGIDLTQTGPEVFGQGPGNTLLIPLPSYNYAGCTFGQTSTACNGATPNLEAHDFGINGAGQATITGNPTITLFELDGSLAGGGCTGSTGFNLSLANWGLLDANAVGFDFARAACGDPVYFNIVSELFGANPCQVSVNTVVSVTGLACLGGNGNYIFQAVFGNVAGATNPVLNVSGSYFSQQMAASQTLIVSASAAPGTYTSSGNFYNCFFTTACGIVRTTGSGTVTLNFNGDNLVYNTASTGGQVFWEAGTNANIHVRGSQVVATGSAAAILNQASGNNFFNDGGNTFLKGSGTDTLSGHQFALPSETQTGSCTTNAATVTFFLTYLNAPRVIVSDTTSASTGAQATATNATTATIHCNGASDTFLAQVIPVPY